ncbi:SLATT domain-containing protein [Helicobacter ailurogastricus]|uniref:SLATT domain-containing protein n=1 Tax=Helicobacter ailurogastricus TaxID=1578720 RepID=UPI000CF11101|nr:SLATT domain-containing protein [Helicobacter ailurogastricus]
MQEVRESYGRATYSKTAFNKELQIREKIYRCIKCAQIILSVLTFGSWLGFIIINQKYSVYSGLILSAVLLALNLYVKETDLVQQMGLFKQGADDLWFICESYISLMTDFQILSCEDIRNRKEKLDKKLGEIYQKYPKTSHKAYEQSRHALKVEEEQFFSKEELNEMLSWHLRR